jgi:glycosyltransferase involved in cell wall biosynthesis
MERMMNGPRLSIVTVTKDDPAGLERTLASTAAWLGNPPAVEQIVIDASVPPATIGNPVIQVVRQHSHGISAAFNEGLQAARGEWVWFLNGGDALHPRLSREWLLQLLSATSAGIVVGALHYDGETTPRSAPPLPKQWPLVGCWIPHPAAIVRRNVLQAAGGFDERWRIAMDFDLWLRLLPQDIGVDVLAVPFASFDVTGLSQRPDKREELQRENAGVLWRYRGLLLSSWLRAGSRLAAALFRAWRKR